MNPADKPLLRALRGEPVDRTPVWLMRQAGRVLPEYRALKEQHGFIKMASTPELADRSSGSIDRRRTTFA